MLLPSHLRITRNGVFQFRLVLPAVLASILGQKEVRRSLGTKRPEGARLRAYELSAKMLPLIRHLAKIMTIDPNSLSPESIRQLVMENVVFKNGATAEKITTSDNPETAKIEMAELKEMVAGGLPPEGENYDFAVREREKILAAMSMPVSVPRPLTLKAAAAAFMQSKKNAAPSTITMYKRRLDVFMALAGGGERLMHMITDVECAEIIDAYNVLPAHDREIKTAAELLANPPNGRVIDSGTIRDHLTLIKSFFNWGIRGKHYSGPNTFMEAITPTGGTSSGGAKPFSQEELKKIFDPVLFADDSHMNRPHKFWGPLFGLFTGARSNEIAQLRLSDFVIEDGVMCIRIEHNLAENVRTKNAASERKLPIHPVLFEIGLQDYLDDLDKIGAKRLFPNLPLDANGKREKYLSRDFNEIHLKNLGIWQARCKVFHSFRDTISNLFVDAEIKDLYIEAWLGHSVKTVTGEFYRKEVSAPKLKPACFPALDTYQSFLPFSEIRYKKNQWNEWLLKNMVP